MSLHQTPLEELVGWLPADERADALARASEARARFAHFRREPWSHLKPARVYVMSDVRGFVKIGIASNPTARAHDLSAGNPEQVHLVFETEAYDRQYAMAVEAAAHDYLAEASCGREWFACGADAAVAAIYLMGGEGEV